MLSENLKNLRKAKGLSQEELAIKLNVVRQTISKWEKGLSVPDSEMLIKLSEALDTPVNALLGETVTPPEETESFKAIAAKLELLNEQFARESERKRKIWRTVFVVLCIAAAFTLLLQIGSLIHHSIAHEASVGIIGGADGPTRIFITTALPDPYSIALTVVVVIVTAFGIYRTRRR